MIIKSKKQKGISLIVLVITIIVMIILASAIILSLDNAGIIERSEEAVEKSNLATVKQLTQLAWGDAYASGARTQAELQAAVDKALADNNVDINLYGIIVTTEGVEVAKGWIKDGLTLKKGNIVLQIGDKIAYDETNGGSITGLTNVEWAVLGVNDNGELLIMSTTNVVSSYRLGYDSTMTSSEARLEESKKDWLTVPNQLDGKCEPYGKGKGAISARSIRVEDVDKVTGFDIDAVKWSKASIGQYGNVITFSYNGTTTPDYSGSNGVSGKMETHTSFHYYDYDKEEFITVTDLTTGTSGTEFAKIKITGYAYYPTTLSGSSTGTVKGITTDTKAYKMLFRNTSNTADVTYWLASTCIGVAEKYVAFCNWAIRNGKVSTGALWASTGSCGPAAFGVRAVVTLASDINLTGSSEAGWSF